jgi:UDP-N-acetylmuramoyl-L-alanyl-D-glutamate--2,6-diaminopimelate ligase
MLAAALKGADFVTVTSDNPRSEDPQAIIHDILAGASSADRNRINVFVDRKQALRETMAASKAEDVILIAGKGHEDYQIIGAEKIPFSDVDIADRLLKELK